MLFCIFIFSCTSTTQEIFTLEKNQIEQPQISDDITNDSTAPLPENLTEKVDESDLIDFSLLQDQTPQNDESINSLINENENLLSRQIFSSGKKTQKELYDFYKKNCPKGGKYLKAKKIAKLYIEECNTEGINSDIAFVQMCLETNFLRYGNLVKSSWNNFCGLGAIDKNNPGLKFKNIKLGVRAHVQHLHAYATTNDIVLKNELVDPRYKYVNPRGKAQDIFGLAGTWATDKEYGNKLNRLLETLEKF